MLSFDEFHSLRNRQRAKSKNGTAATLSVAGRTALAAPIDGGRTLGQQLEGGKSNSNGTAKHDIASKAASSTRAPSFTPLHTSTIGQFLELYEVQLFMVMLILLDVVLSTMGSLITQGQSSNMAEAQAEAAVLEAWGWSTVHRTVEAITGFTVFLFAFELAALAVAFRSGFTRHLGYMLDAALVLLMVLEEINGHSREVRLLGVLRSWRVVRLVNTLLAAERENTEGVRKELQLEQKKLQELHISNTKLEEASRREADSRKRVEQLLRGYKDEVDTLNEALKIAALDIAEAAVSDMDDDEEEDLEGMDRREERAAAASGAEMQRIVVSKDGSFQMR